MTYEYDADAAEHQPQNPPPSVDVDSPEYWIRCGVNKNSYVQQPPVEATQVTWALHWAALGFYVFPTCWPDSEGQCACGRQKGPHEGKQIGKAPLIKGWPEEATRDPKKIIGWWRSRRWANANIGALDNARSRLVVVDNDKDSPNARMLREALIPHTRVHQSGGADYKWHAVFLRPEGLVIPARHTTELGINLESSGQFLLPPSRHLSGRRYTIVSDLPPAQMPADFLTWLQSLPLEKREEKSRKAGNSQRQTKSSTRSALTAAIAGGIKEVPPFTDYEKTKLRSALWYHDNGEWILDPREPSFEAWSNVLYPLAWLIRKGWPWDWVRDLFIEWSAEAKGLQDNEGRDIFSGPEKCSERLHACVYKRATDRQKPWNENDPKTAETNDTWDKDGKTVYTIYWLVRERGWQPPHTLDEPPSWSEAEQAGIQSMLDIITEITRDEWLDIGRALHWLGWDERGRLLWVGFSRRFPEPLDEAGLNTQWGLFDTEKRDEPITLGTLISIAQRFGWTDPYAEIKLEDFFAYLPQNEFLHIPTRALWPRTAVDMKIGPVLVGKGKKIAAALWLVRNRAVAQMTWSPGEPLLIHDRFIEQGGWVPHPGAKVVNTYRPPTIVPGDPDKAGIWLKHVEIVFGEYARHIILYLAHRVQRSWEKINHALVLGGAPGIGKDAMLAPVREAVGPWNFMEASPKQILGRFNGFLKSVILRINEARDLGEVNQYAFYDSLKTIIAAPPEVHRIDEKHIREYNIINVNGTIILTNYKHGLFLPSNDRRHYVAWSGRAMEEFNQSYWQELFDFYGHGGIEHVCAYLSQPNLIENFDPKVPPPKTPAFWAVVDTHRASEDAELDDVLDRLGRPPIVTLEATKKAALSDPNNFELWRWLEDHKNRAKIPHRMEECGYAKIRNPDADDGLWKLGGRRQVIYGREILTPKEQLAAAVKHTSSSSK